MLHYKKELPVSVVVNCNTPNLATHVLLHLSGFPSETCTASETPLLGFFSWNKVL